MTEPTPKGMIRITYVLTYQSDVDMSSYPGMTPDQAIAHELDLSESEIIETMSTCDEEELDVNRTAVYVE